MKKIDILKWLNNMNIRKKLMLSYIMVVLPVLLIAFVLTYSMQKMVTDRAMYEAGNSVERVYTRLSAPLKLAQDLFVQFYMDTNLEKIVTTQYESIEDVVNTYSTYYGISNGVVSHIMEVQDIKLFTYNKSMLKSAQFITIDDDLSEESWLKRAESFKGGIYWQMVYSSARDSNLLSLTAQLKGSTQLKPLGIIVISLNQSCLTAIIKDEPYDTVILDDVGNVVAAKSEEFAGKRLGDTKYKELISMPSGIHELKYKNETSKAIVKTIIPSICNKEFRIVSLVPLSTITGKVYDTFRLAFLMMMICLLLAAALFSFFSNVISRRVKSVSNDMHTVALGNFNLSPSVVGDDEFGQLSRDLGVMVKSIKELVHEVYEVNLQKNQLAVRQREIKLKILSSQINPHFLFNALEAIRMKAYCNGDNEVAEVIMLLGKIMRKNLEVENELVVLSDEIDLVKSYLEIQKFRFTYRFNYRLDYDCRLDKYKLLPLMVQPIIENAVVHGLKYVEEGGEISLEAYQKYGMVRIVVEDNGCGMEEGRLREIIDGLNDVEDIIGQHIGLRNVYQRIKLYYGEKYGMTISSTLGKGTRVEITLPEERGIYA